MVVLLMLPALCPSATSDLALGSSAEHACACATFGRLACWHWPEPSIMSAHALPCSCSTCAGTAVAADRAITSADGNAKRLKLRRQAVEVLASFLN